MILTSAIILFVIFVMNIIPAFMPPTWILLSFIGFTFHFDKYSLVILCIFAAIASTSGRIVLAIFSDKMIRNKILTEKSKRNIDILKEQIEKRKSLTFGFFLSYAFSPFPSGQLFLAYGLTELKLQIAAIPFFIGRLVSYLFWALSASEVSKMMDITTLKSGTYFGAFFVLTQITAFVLVYFVVRVDWNILFEKHKLKFIKKIID